MKYLISIVLVVLCFPQSKGAAQDIGVDTVGKQIITAEFMRKAGITRLSDVFLLIDSWQESSIDGYRFQASANGLATFQGQHWILMLDGQRINSNVFGTQNINRLPVTMEMIASVEVINTPIIFSGEFSQCGLLNIRTKKPEKGFSVSGRFMAGNETGDPGPFRYTEFTSENIEKIGPDQSGVIAYGWENGFARVGFFRQAFATTEQRLTRRNQNVNSNFFVGAMSGPLTQLGVHAFGGEHQLYLGYATSDAKSFFPNAVFSADNLFFRPAGREIPTESSYLHIGLNGNVPASDEINFLYNLKVSRNKLGNPGSFEGKNVPEDFDWNMNNASGSVTVKKSGMESKWEAGVGFYRRNLDTKYNLSDNKVTLYKAHSEIYYNLQPGIKQKLGLFVVFADDDLAFKSSFTNFWQPVQNHNITSVLSFSQRLFAEDNSLWFWVNRGYDFLNDNGYDYSFNEAFDKSSNLTFDSSWQFDQSAKTSIRFGINYRYFRYLYIERQRYQYDPDNITFSSSTVVNNGVNGQNASINVKAVYKISHAAKNSVYYSFRAITSGDAIFEKEWESVPRHTFKYSFEIEPVKNLSLFTAIGYVSSADWVDFTDVTRQSQGLYRSRVRSRISVDTSVQKWLWHRQLRTNILVRNIFNGRQESHPFSTRFDLSFYVQAELLLDTIF